MRSLLLLLISGAVIVSSIAGNKPVNTAVIPVGRLENDFYDWDKRHAEVLAIKDKVNPEFVLIGDSITHLWAADLQTFGRGAEAWKSLFGEHHALNLGFGWDRTQNVLWRIEHGELEGLNPKAVVINIGTNNLAGTKNAQANTPQEIAEAIGVIVERVKSKCPNAQIILMKIFPRGQNPTDPHRASIAEINRLLEPLSKVPRVTLLDITSKLTNTDGTISKDVMGDYLHPTAKGYSIWAEALREVLPK